MKIFTSNRKANFEYFVEDTEVAGICLLGWEVKSILDGKVSLNESYVKFVNGELMLIGSHITPPSSTPFSKPDPTRSRKLLLTSHQINKWLGKVNLNGYTIIALDIHYSESKKIKLTLGLCKGKKQHDKRETIKQRDLDRQVRKEYYAV